MPTELMTVGFACGLDKLESAELLTRLLHPLSRRLAQGRHTTVKVLPKYAKRTTQQIVSGTKKRRAYRDRKEREQNNVRSRSE